MRAICQMINERMIHGSLKSIGRSNQYNAQFSAFNRQSTIGMHLVLDAHAAARRRLLPHKPRPPADEHEQAARRVALPAEAGQGAVDAFLDWRSTC